MTKKKALDQLTTNNISPLPDYLGKRYSAWHSTNYQNNKSWYQNLANFGQHPRAMIISCCDSRVNAMSLFGGEDGDFFIHRNIANLIPPFSPDGDHHGTSSAIEFAVMVLKVSHMIVLGHSGCGGIMTGYHACMGKSHDVLEQSNFIAKWLEILKPAFADGTTLGSDEERIHDLEQRSIVHSLNNLMGFPFVSSAVKAEQLTLHGLWHDIGSGQLHVYDAEHEDFLPVPLG